MFLSTCWAENDHPDDAGADTLRTVLTETAILANPVVQRWFPAGQAPPQLTSLAFDIGRRLGTVHLQIGQTVQPGEVLANVDDNDAKLRLQHIQSALSKETVALRLTDWLNTQPDVVDTTAYIGSGEPRFVLALDPADTDPAAALIIMDITTFNASTDLIERAHIHSAQSFPKASFGFKRLTIGGREPGVDAARKRFRLIVLTSTLTVIGLALMAISGGGLWEPTETLMMGGLSVASLLALFCVPALYCCTSHSLPELGIDPRLGC